VDRVRNDALLALANSLMLGSLLERVWRRWGSYRLRAHWTQGEFHHDLVVELEESFAGLPGAVLVIATNCNGGVKEVLCFDAVPERGALWRSRCPGNPEFEGELPTLLARETTAHWFDPCELLRPDARSELREEFRVRQPGGGWMPKSRKVDLRK
jgi:hypothetical protein